MGQAVREYVPVSFGYGPESTNYAEGVRRPETHAMLRQALRLPSPEDYLAWLRERSNRVNSGDTTWTEVLDDRLAALNETFVPTAGIYTPINDLFDLDVLDQLVLMANDPDSVKRRKERDQEVRELRMDRVEDQMAHTEVYTAAGLPDYKVGVFDDLEVDLGLVSAAVSDLAPAASDLDDRWANFRDQGWAPSFSPEGIEYGVWNLEQGLTQTRDLTSHLRGAAADAPWARYRTQGQVPRVRSDELGHGLWDLEDSQAHTRDWTSGLPAAAVGGELARAPNFALMAQDAADAASFELWEMEHPDLGIRGGAPVPTQAMGGGLAQAAESALRMQDAVGDASFELWELEDPLLRTRDGALGLAEAMGDGYGGQGVTGAMDGAGLAADGLALSTGTAEQALLAAGLTGDSTTQVLDLMRRAGLDPATAAWDELATAVHVWGDATDTEVTRVIGRLGDLSSAQGGGGTAPGGSTGGGGADDRAPRGLDQLMALAQAVARTRADMGDLHPQHIAHELGKLPGQLRGPGSLAEQLALLRLFFAGSAHGISFGLGPSAGSLGFNIPQFAEGGVVPGPLGAPQVVVAHGGEHIVPHRATSSPTIIRIELDREVLAQAVLGDLLRLQGREVTLGLS